MRGRPAGGNIRPAAASYLRLAPCDEAFRHGEMRMNRRRLVTAHALAALTLMILAPTVLADTCCANTSVAPTPRMAVPGDTVRLDGIACLAADNSGPLPLNPVEFWL